MNTILPGNTRSLLTLKPSDLSPSSWTRLQTSWEGGMLSSLQMLYLMRWYIYLPMIIVGVKYLQYDCTLPWNHINVNIFYSIGRTYMAERWRRPCRTMRQILLTWKLSKWEDLRFQLSPCWAVDQLQRNACCGFVAHLSRPWSIGWIALSFLFCLFVVPLW